MSLHKEGVENQRARHAAILVLALGSVFTVTWTTTAIAQESKPGAASQQSAQYTEEGAENCLFCHAAERMQVISKTPHGDPADKNTPFGQHGCESCHGPGSLHATRSRRGRGRPSMIIFGEKASTAPKVQTGQCLDCHKEPVGHAEGMEWKGSVHANESMTCSACHEIHTTANPLENREQQAEICYACHEKTKSEHPRFEKQGIVFDQLSCWNCHDVHQLIPENEAAWISDALHLK